MMRKTTGHLLALAATLCGATAAQATEWRAQPPLPFVATLSNNAPLQFGLTVEETAATLGAPLVAVRGKPGDETYVAAAAGGHFFTRTDTLFLQFRKNRLTGWKVDRRIAGAPW